MMPQPDASVPAVSVVMPTYAQGSFIARAIESLLAQSFADWELVIVDDGSPDATREVVEPYLADPRIRYIPLERNGGLGTALNIGLSHARAPLIAYLPSDDLYHRDHLATLTQALGHAVLAVAGVRYRYNKHAPGRIPGEPLQLVQCLHRAGSDRWVERAELTTDDLDAMFWTALAARGTVVETGHITCEWVDHPHQRHKAIRSPDGGVNPYRVRYKVAEPLRFRNTTGLDIDEVERFQRYRDRPAAAPANDALKILLVGELAYNPERVLALAERGHALYGLWTDTPAWFNWVGPQPFGHVEDLPADDWVAAAQRIQPDVIYALLNWQTVPFARGVQRENPGIPFVWHFKEGPFICLEKGIWPALLDLYLEADGRIYSSAEMRDWFVDGDRRLGDDTPTLILDGDLPKHDLLRADRSPRLSDGDGEIHTVVPGRPIGLHPETVADLAAQGIHLHFYGEFIQDMWRAWIERTRGLAGRFLHIHPTVHQERWVEEFSRYDAGWLHFFQSRNEGEARRADWDDLNLPARMATLGVCGLPMLQRDNTGHLVATQTLVRDEGLGFFFSDMVDLGRQLRDRAALDAARDRVWAARHRFTFDHHADDLIAFFRQVIARGANKADAQPLALSIA